MNSFKLSISNSFYFVLQLIDMGTMKIQSYIYTIYEQDSDIVSSSDVHSIETKHIRTDTLYLGDVITK